MRNAIGCVAVIAVALLPAGAVAKTVLSNFPIDDSASLAFHDSECDFVPECWTAALDCVDDRLDVVIGSFPREDISRWMEGEADVSLSGIAGFGPLHFDRLVYEDIDGTWSVIFSAQRSGLTVEGDTVEIRSSLRTTTAELDDQSRGEVLAFIAACPAQ